jgi:glycosyltransferase involved in cell wall biosynthesis
MEPIVDINIAVYNQAPYLRQTIESVLAQVTNFKFRLLIGDDCSTDGSVEIIKEYESKYPHLIKAILQEKNLGFSSPITNGIILLKNSTAKYIALLDGDDYWTDPHKLQRQVDLLEKRQDIVCFFHNAEVINENGFVRLYNDSSNEIRLIQDEVLETLMIPTSSVLFRNKVQEMPQWLLNFCMDITLYFHLAGFGDFYGSPQVMSGYRMHGGGIWTGQEQRKKLSNHINIRNRMLENLPLSKRQKKIIRQIIVSGRLQRIKHAANSYSFNITFFKDLLKVFRDKIAGFHVSTKYLIFCILPDRFIFFVNRLRKAK